MPFTKRLHLCRGYSFDKPLPTLPTVSYYFSHYSSRYQAMPIPCDGIFPALILAKQDEALSAKIHPRTGTSLEYEITDCFLETMGMESRDLQTVMPILLQKLFSNIGTWHRQESGVYALETSQGKAINRILKRAYICQTGIEFKFFASPKPRIVFTNLNLFNLALLYSLKSETLEAELSSLPLPTEIPRQVNSDEKPGDALNHYRFLPGSGAPSGTIARTLEYTH
jgi:hypothetical protein